MWAGQPDATRFSWGNWASSATSRAQPERPRQSCASWHRLVDRGQRAAGQHRGGEDHPAAGVSVDHQQRAHGEDHRLQEHAEQPPRPAQFRQRSATRAGLGLDELPVPRAGLNQAALHAHRPGGFRPGAVRSGWLREWRPVAIVRSRVPDSVRRLVASVSAVSTSVPSSAVSPRVQCRAVSTIRNSRTHGRSMIAAGPIPDRKAWTWSRSRSAAGDRSPLPRRRVLLIVA